MSTVEGRELRNSLLPPASLQLGLRQWDSRFLWQVRCPQGLTDCDPDLFWNPPALVLGDGRCTTPWKITRSFRHYKVKNVFYFQLIIHLWKYHYILHLPLNLTLDLLKIFNCIIVTLTWQTFVSKMPAELLCCPPGYHNFSQNGRKSLSSDLREKQICSQTFPSAHSAHFFLTWSDSQMHSSPLMTWQTTEL